jgi:TrmH family RNA methyltransferase
LLLTFDVYYIVVSRYNMDNYTKICSRDNDNIKLFTKLSESKKYRREHMKFTLEGLRLIADAAGENAELHCVFVTESFMSKHSDALDFLGRSNIGRIYIISDELGKKISTTDGTQGIFAVCGAIDKFSISDTIKTGGRYILLHNIQDPGNMGTIIRTADAVGLNAVIAVNCCDIYNPKVIRSTMGSLFRMPVIDTDISTAMNCFKSCGIKTYAAVIDSNALSLSSCDFSDGGAVLIGNEGNGLPEDIAMQCSERLTIKMRGNVNSLNAAMAAGIIMWELAGR